MAVTFTYHDDTNILVYNDGQGHVNEYLLTNEPAELWELVLSQLTSVSLTAASGTVVEDWAQGSNPAKIPEAKVEGLTEALGKKLDATQGAAVEDATGPEDLQTQFNALLASLRAAKVIATV